MKKELEKVLQDASIGRGDLVYFGGGTKEVRKEVVGFVHWYDASISVLGVIGLTQSWPCYAHHEPKQYCLDDFREFKILKRAKQ